MIHQNSIAAFDAISDLGDRQRAVWDAFGVGPLTDRQVSQMLARELYTVRPRITELIAAKMLVEIGSAKDPVTDRSVRLCARADLAVVQ